MGDEEFVVEAILAKRLSKEPKVLSGGRLVPISRYKEEYLVKWSGFPIKECTWEPKTHLRHLVHMLSPFDCLPLAVIVDSKPMSRLPNGSKKKQPKKASKTKSPKTPKTPKNAAKPTTNIKTVKEVKIKASPSSDPSS